MAGNRALVADPDGPGGVGFADVPEPAPGPDEVVVRVRYAGVAPADLPNATGAAPGRVLGRDVAGTVLHAAADGVGPDVGARVVALAAGGWANRVAVPVDRLAIAPPEVDLAGAAAVPSAGLTVLRALRAAGPVRGGRVLVTGAADGLGRLAVQLAAVAGASVVASVRRLDAGLEAELRELGAAEVVAGLDDVGEPVDIALDGVGGPALARSYALLRPGGAVQSIGWSSGRPAVFEPGATLLPGAARTILSFGDLADPAEDLAVLVGLLADGDLTAPVTWRGSWTRVADGIRAAASGGVVLSL